VEQSLVERVIRGEWLDLTSKGEATDDAAMRSWGDARTCRATVIREILRGGSLQTPIHMGCDFRAPGSLAALTWRISLRKSASS
jgi:hypothetical protein